MKVSVGNGFVLHEQLDDGPGVTSINYEAAAEDHSMGDSDSNHDD